MEDYKHNQLARRRRQYAYAIFTSGWALIAAWAVALGTAWLLGFFGYALWRAAAAGVHVAAVLWSWL